MKTRFNFHPVQIIGEYTDTHTHTQLQAHIHAHTQTGSEGITAGTFLPSVTCLVHGKVLKTHTDFWVRTPSSLLTESIIKQAQMVFK